MQTTTQRLWTRELILLLGSTMMLWGCHYFLVPVLPMFAVQKLGATGAQVGLMSSAMTITAVFVRPLAGYALDRWGRRWIQIGFLVAFCGVVWGFGLVRSVAMLVAARMLQAIPFGVTTTAGVTVAADLVPGSRRGEGMSVFGIAQTVAMAIMPLLALKILGEGEFSRTFVVAGGFCLVAALFAYLVRHPLVRDPSTSFSLSSIVEKRVLWISLVQMFVSTGYSSVVVFITLYTDQTGIGNAGLFFMVSAVGTILARSVAGRVFDRHGPRLVFCVGLCSLSVAYASLAAWQTSVGFLVGAFVLGAAMGAIRPTLEAMAVNVVPAARRGAANATILAGFDVGMALGSSILGAVAQAAGSYATMYWVDAGVVLIPAILFLGWVLPSYSKSQKIRAKV